MAAQAIHAFLAGEADGADGEAKFGGDFGIRARRRFKEEQFDEALALRRKRGNRVAQDLLFLRLLDEFFRDGWSFGIGNVGIRVAAYQTLLLALPAKALMMSDLHKPLGKSFRFAQFRQAMEQFDTSRLKNFGRFVRREFVFDGNGVDERFVFIDESGPGVLIALEAGLHELEHRSGRR